MTDITLEGITKVFGSGTAAVAAVDNVSLKVSSGELYFLLGPSGCGKTTLLRIIAGLTDPTAGRVLFGAKDVTNLPVERRNAAMVFQSYALWPHMTVEQNVQFAPKMKGVDRARRIEIARQQLLRVQMADFADRKPNQLSGGQQQRVALARALAAESEALLLDEPLSNLDARLRLHMRTELRRLIKQTRTTAIYVTHDQKEALSMADRIAVMNDGRIVQIGTPHELYARPATRFVADFLGEANFVDGRCIEAGPPARIKTPLGVIVAAEAPRDAAGRNVTCCIRPENVTIQPAGQGTDDAPNTIRARVDTSIYLGEIRQYLCTTPQGAGWKVSTVGKYDPAIDDGTEVVLSFEPRHVAVITE